MDVELRGYASKITNTQTAKGLTTTNILRHLVERSKKKDKDRRK